MRTRAPTRACGSTMAVGWMAVSGWPIGSCALLRAARSNRSSFCSSARTRCSSSGSRASATMIRLACRIGRAGEPSTFSPAARSDGTPAWAADDHAVADRHVVGDAHLPGQDHAAPEPRRARDADLRHQQRVLADHHVVADLHQVVDLGPAPHDRVAEGGAVDRGVGADLDVVLDQHAAHLGNLTMGRCRRTRNRSRRRPSTAPA